MHCCSVSGRGCVLQSRPYRQAVPPHRSLRCHGVPRPTQWTQVMPWARGQLKEELATSDVSLAKACMLLALEEEACIETHPELQELLAAQPDSRFRSMASASTWSLERLDALAAEVQALLLNQRLTQPPATAPLSSTSSPEASGEAELAPHAAAGGTGRGTSADDGLGDSGVRQQLRLDPSLLQTSPLLVLDALNTVLFERHGYQACGRFGNPRRVGSSSS
ncbi:hypothetical protein V8C86DRAFT_2599071 [Haematococcus lacustris]